MEQTLVIYPHPATVEVRKYSLYPGNPECRTIYKTTGLISSEMAVLDFKRLKKRIGEP